MTTDHTGPSSVQSRKIVMQTTCENIVDHCGRFAFAVDMKSEFVVICADAEVRACLKKTFVRIAAERDRPLVPLSEECYQIPSPVKDHWVTLRFLQPGETLALVDCMYMIVLGYGPDEPIWHETILPVMRKCMALGIVLSSEDIHRGETDELCRPDTWLTDEFCRLDTWLTQHKERFLAPTKKTPKSKFRFTLTLVYYATLLGRRVGIAQPAQRVGNVVRRPGVFRSELIFGEALGFGRRECPRTDVEVAKQQAEVVVLQVLTNHKFQTTADECITSARQLQHARWCTWWTVISLCWHRCLDGRFRLLLLQALLPASLKGSLLH